MPEKKLRVLVVDGRPERGQALAHGLDELGFTLAGVMSDGQQACQYCTTLSADLVLMANELPGGDGVETARALLRRAPLPVVLLTERDDRALLDRAQRAGVQSYLLAPVEAAVLGPALELAYRNFQRESRLSGEVADLREDLRRRKLLERARGLIMDRFGVDQAEAQLRLELLSQTQGCTLHQAAEAVVETQRLLAPSRRRRQSRKA